ncbi:hypothetical protein F0L68_00190 [Solihabitans fulvus]|uniref:Excreted virulence factor EspC, type VII ESX diderm n=1 Tax=Solihabitans fulvus TaxID=1892852 RepID=A0A5B2XWC8_9PSEU|nr:hypothetical protein [Solihabitans fulvus]KAA2266994.1 hypothetical protein F0L68_00190 [Solihabitans fulvus]
MAVAPPDGALAVTADSLGKAGQDVMNTADEMNRNVRAHSGAQEGDGGANRSFATAQAHADCETGWQDALTVFGTKIATAGDNIVLSAATYQGVENANQHLLQPR